MVLRPSHDTAVLVWSKLSLDSPVAGVANMGTGVVEAEPRFASSRRREHGHGIGRSFPAATRLCASFLPSLGSGWKLGKGGEGLGKCLIHVRVAVCHVGDELVLCRFPPAR